MKTRVGSASAGEAHNTARTRPKRRGVTEEKGPNGADVAGEPVAHTPADRPARILSCLDARPNDLALDGLERSRRPR